MTIKKPNEGEFKPYFTKYIDLMPADGNVLQHLQYHYNEFRLLVNSMNEDRLNYRYAENKWTIREVLIHMIDTERIFAIRALRISRNDKVNLPGYEQDDYVPFSNAENRTKESILQEFDTVRAATLSLFNSFNEEQLVRIGTASESTISVRAIAYIIAGHQKHHINIIEDRYL